MISFVDPWTLAASLTHLRNRRLILPCWYLGFLYGFLSHLLIILTNHIAQILIPELPTKHLILCLTLCNGGTILLHSKCLASSFWCHGFYGCFPNGQHQKRTNKEKTNKCDNKSQKQHRPATARRTEQNYTVRQHKRFKTKIIFVSNITPQLLELFVIRFVEGSKKLAQELDNTLNVGYASQEVKYPKVCDYGRDI